MEKAQYAPGHTRARTSRCSRQIRQPRGDGTLFGAAGVAGTGAAIQAAVAQGPRGVVRALAAGARGVGCRSQPARGKRGDARPRPAPREGGGTAPGRNGTPRWRRRLHSGPPVTRTRGGPMSHRSPVPEKLLPGQLLLRTQGACGLDPGRLLQVFGEQRHRFVTVLRGFGPEDWAAPTRCAEAARSPGRGRARRPRTDSRRPRRPADRPAGRPVPHGGLLQHPLTPRRSRTVSTFPQPLLARRQQDRQTSANGAR